MLNEMKSAYGGLSKRKTTAILMLLIFAVAGFALIHAVSTHAQDTALIKAVSH